MKTLFRQALIGSALFLLAGGVNAALIAHYTFDDGTAANDQGDSSRDLTSVGTNSFAGGSYRSDGSSSNYLEVSGPGGMSDFTVSLWAFTETANQGDFKGLFSNNTGSTTSASWQIDSSSGSFVLNSAQGSSPATFGPVLENTWQHIVLQKFGGNNARLYLDGSPVGNLGYNPGGLQNFRIGINRNSNQSFDGFIDNIRIFNDSAQDVATLFAEGPGRNAATPVPAPGTVALVGIGMLALAALRRRTRAAEL